MTPTVRRVHWGTANPTLAGPTTSTPPSRGGMVSRSRKRRRPMCDAQRVAAEMGHPPSKGFSETFKHLPFSARYPAPYLVSDCPAGTVTTPAPAC
jgi:hypothetical protein